MQAKLEIKPPHPGRTPFYSIRGTYLGQRVERSTGSREIAVARKALAKIKSDIERGAFAPVAGPTFVSAATAYMNGGGERRFVDVLLLHFAKASLGSIDQAAIDGAAAALYPDASPATRNRQVYTPMQAILRHAGVSLAIRRPKGAQGTPRKHWLRPEDATKLLDAAWLIHPRFAALCTALLYTGCRLSEALAIQVADVHLDAGFIDLADTKNGEPQRLHLPPIAIQAVRLALMQPGNATWTDQVLPRAAGSLFCLTKSGALYDLLGRAEEVSGVRIPDGVSFHILRHSYGAWMRAAGGRLEETGRWSSRAGAKAYDHYEVSAAARKADMFPGASLSLAAETAA